MNTIFSRRRFLAQLAAAPISTAIGSDLSAFMRNSNNDLTAVCVFAWAGAKSPVRTVDLWMARCGLVDVCRLSNTLGKFVVWDDITSDRTGERSIGTIKSAISLCFGVE